MTVMHSLYREPGTVEIDEDTCKNCGQCAQPKSLRWTTAACASAKTAPSDASLAGIV